MAAVDVDQLKSGAIDYYAISELAPSFPRSFAALSVLMTYKNGKEQKNKPDETKTTAPSLPFSSSAIGQKRERPVSLSGLPPKRVKSGDGAEILQQPTTPDQPTIPSDPRRTNDTSYTDQSQPEDNTKTLMQDFMGESLSALKREFGYISWQNSGHNVHLFQRYSSFSSCLKLVAWKP